MRSHRTAEGLYAPAFTPVLRVVMLFAALACAIWLGLDAHPLVTIEGTFLGSG